MLYQPTWESLDNRPLPAWFPEATAIAETVRAETQGKSPDSFLIQFPHGAKCTLAGTLGQRVSKLV